MAAKGGAGKTLHAIRLSKNPGTDRHPPSARKMVFNERQRAGAGPIIAKNKIKTMDDAGMYVTHDAGSYFLKPENRSNSKYSNHRNHETANTRKTISPQGWNPGVGGGKGWHPGVGGGGGANGETANKRQTVLNFTDPNQLFQFASYNTIFTLSALRTEEMKNTKTLLTSTPHDIILQSGGIGPNNPDYKSQAVPPSMRGIKQDGMSEEDEQLLKKNKRVQPSLDKVQEEFKKNNDMYISTVTTNNVAGLNEKRRLTSVTNLTMEIVEPYGITLIDRIRAAAANNFFLDHVDAPFLLTIEFVGWDENGKQITTDTVGRSLKRVIPIKFTDIQMQVNQGGTTYTVTAIPYNEFPYANRFNYIRTAGTIEPKGRMLSDVAQELEEMLNKQGDDEIKNGFLEFADKYEITIDESFDPGNTEIHYKTLSQSSMYRNNAIFGKGPHANTTYKDGGVLNADGKVVKQKQASSHPTAANYPVSEPIEYMKIEQGKAIIKILEEIMKAHPRFASLSFDDWHAKVSKTLQEAGDNADSRAKADDMYYHYYKIRASVIPVTEKFDKKRRMHQQFVTYTVSPYKIHAYSKAIPGVSTGQAMKPFVYKTYNYIFTGENVDILNCDIAYNMGYFQSSLKSTPPDITRQNVYEENVTDNTHDHGSDADDEIWSPGTMGELRKYPGVHESGGTGSTSSKTTHFDQFLDYLTHPLADMVNVKLDILGDPAWMGQSQFMPAVTFKYAPGISSDKDIAYWRGDPDAIWNEELRCFNPDLAEPIIMLNFRMPTDINDREGTYEIAKEQQATFSGLYRVIQINHTWENGAYTNTLDLTRFNNQGVIISDPESLGSKQGKSGTGDIMTSTQLKNADRKGSNETEFSFLGSIRDNIKRKVDRVTQKFHPSQGNVAKQFHPSQGNVSQKFHPSQGNIRKGSASKQGTAFNPSQGNVPHRFNPSQGNRQSTPKQDVSNDIFTGA